MEGFLVSAATGALKSVVEKLACALGKECTLFMGVRDKIEFLAKELHFMHAFLVKMSEEENPDVQDKVWMKEVRELSYDMEDAIDEFMLSADGKSTKPDGFIVRIENFVASMMSRRHIAKMIEEFKIQVNEVNDMNRRYRSGETIVNASTTTVDPRALAIFEDASKLVGVDGPKNELIKLLTRDDGCNSSEHMKLVSSIGSTEVPGGSLAPSPAWHSKGNKSWGGRKEEEEVIDENEVEPALRPPLVISWIWRNGKDNPCKPCI